MITSLVPRRRPMKGRAFLGPTRISRESCGNLIILRCHWWLKRHNSFISGHAKWPCGSVSLWIIISRSSSSGNWWWLCRISGLHRKETIALIIVMHADCRRRRRRRGHCNWRVLQELTDEGEQRFNSRNHLTQMPVSGSLIIPFEDSIAGLGRTGIPSWRLLYSSPVSSVLCTILCKFGKSRQLRWSTLCAPRDSVRALVLVPSSSHHLSHYTRIAGFEVRPPRIFLWLWWMAAGWVDRKTPPARDRSTQDRLQIRF